MGFYYLIAIAFPHMITGTFGGREDTLAYRLVHKNETKFRFVCRFKY